jgi:uncharacterized protein (TIGR03435 family)
MRHAAIALLILFGQPAAKPAFDVATIKRSAQLEPGGTLRMQPGGLFRSVNVDVRGLMLSAYRTAQRRLFASQIIGAPAWLSTDRYDITARVGSELAARPDAELFPQLPLLLQSLLEDRFKLTLHHETREQPVFVLTVANRDRGLGAQLRPVSIDCARTPEKCGIHFAIGHLSAESINLETLVGLLSRQVERVSSIAPASRVRMRWISSGRRINRRRTSRRSSRRCRSSSA